MEFETVIATIKNLPLGTPIPKPESGEATIARWRKRRGSPALIYQMPNHSKPAKPHEKGIAVDEFRLAYEQIQHCGTFTRQWFKANMPACHKDGGCNFTTIGGIFSLINIAQYDGPGRYTAQKSSARP